jgi:hypothetical protein
MFLIVLGQKIELFKVLLQKMKFMQTLGMKTIF